MDEIVPIMKEALKRMDNNNGNSGPAKVSEDRIFGDLVCEMILSNVLCTKTPLKL